MRKIDRFDKYMNIKGLNDNKVTVQVGLTVGVLGKSRKERRDLSDNSIEQILNFYTDLDRVWLLTGEGEMLRTEKKDKKIEQNFTSNSGINIAANGNVNDNHINMVAERLQDKEEIIELLKEKTKLQNELIAAKNRDIKELTEQCAHLLNELTAKNE